MHLTMPSPNTYAVGTVVEATKLNQTQPFFSEKAHWDGTPIHIGLGESEVYDLTIRFPDGTVRNLKEVQANTEMVIHSLQ